MDDGYVPQSPDLSALHNPPPSSHAHLPQHDPAPFHSAPPTSDPALHTRESFSLPAAAAAARHGWPAPDHPAQPQTDHLAYQQHQAPGYGLPPADPGPAAGRPRRVKREPLDPDYIPPGPLSPTSNPGGMPPAKTSSSAQQSLPVIKTKFPIARIKRIVQADEDVGKVAQATPVAVSKALEQFMISLARRSADEARARGSKKVTAADMKGAVGKDEVFDFLSDVVDRIPDAPSKKASVSKESDSDDDAPPAARGKKRKTASGGRRKKTEDFDDD